MFEGFRQGSFVGPDGIEIAYVMGGCGSPLLLLHGYPQTKEMWARVAPQLAKDHTVICADLRGYGASAKPRSLPDQSNYSFRAMATDQLWLMQSLGFERFHVAGHDRGGRTAYRMALDYPDAVATLAVLDIIPTDVMFERMNNDIARAYWHWHLLAQPEPLPERIIGADPDTFYQICLTGWGSTALDAFDPDQLQAYRSAWRNPEMIHASCADYRAAREVDWPIDAADAGGLIKVPTLVLFGSLGTIAKHFDIVAEWRQRCEVIVAMNIAGGHFFVDEFPDETALRLRAFLKEFSING